jgi:hypothetical protein
LDYSLLVSDAMQYGNQHFKGTSCLRLVAKEITSYNVKTEAARCSKTLVTSYHTKQQHHIP